jgi:hypothetical protein
MSYNRIAILSVVFVVIITLTIGLINARTGFDSDPSSNPAGVLANQEQSSYRSNMDNTRSYRSRLGVCFDVSLKELNSCLQTSQAPVLSYRSRLGECFDVSLGELSSCRKASQAPVPSYRSHLDECFDVSLGELSSCRKASRVAVP